MCAEELAGLQDREAEAGSEIEEEEDEGKLQVPAWCGSSRRPSTIGYRSCMSPSFEDT